MKQEEIIPIEQLDNLARINEINQLTNLLLAEQEKLGQDFIRAMTTLTRSIQLLKQGVPDETQEQLDFYLNQAQATMDILYKTMTKNIVDILQAWQVELENLPQRN